MIPDLMLSRLADVVKQESTLPRRTYVTAQHSPP